MATELGFKLNLNFKQVEPIKVEEVEKPYFNQEMFKLIEKSELEIAKENHDIRNGLTKGVLKVTSYVIGKVRIVYDGASYEAHLLKPMLKDGFLYWKTLYEKEIAFARAMCYAQHVIKFGNYGQPIPPAATAYLTIAEHSKLMMEQAIATKNAISWDNIPKVTKQQEETDGE